MSCFHLKGGIGSASRIAECGGQVFTVGALVLSNFGYSPIGYVATKLPNLIGNPIAQGIVNLLV